MAQIDVNLATAKEATQLLVKADLDAIKANSDKQQYDSNGKLLVSTPATDVSGLATQVTLAAVKADLDKNLYDAAGNLKVVTAGVGVKPDGTRVPLNTDASGTLQTADSGLGTDGANPPATTGTGVRGWLRAISERLNATLAADVTDRAARLLGHVTVDNGPDVSALGTETTQVAVRDRLPAALNADGGLKVHVNNNSGAADLLQLTTGVVAASASLSTVSFDVTGLTEVLLTLAPVSTLSGVSVEVSRDAGATWVTVNTETILRGWRNTQDSAPAAITYNNTSGFTLAAFSTYTLQVRTFGYNRVRLNNSSPTASQNIFAYAGGTSEALVKRVIIENGTSVIGSVVLAAASTTIGAITGGVGAALGGSSNAALGAGGSFSSGTQTTPSNHVEAIASAGSDVAGTIYIEQLFGANWFPIASAAVPAGGGAQARAALASAGNVRARYVNGPAAQTTFGFLAMTRSAS